MKIQNSKLRAKAGGRRFRSRSGQTLLYMASALALLTVMGLWLVDSNTTIVNRIRVQNAADSSALAAAQWQARSLNAIGEINLIKAINNLLDNPPPGSVQTQLTGDADEDYYTIQNALDLLQVQITYEGPILAMLAAQQAAKNNGMADNATYTQDIISRSVFVAANPDLFTIYATGTDGVYPWNDGLNWGEKYAQMLNYVADQGVAVKNGSTRYTQASYNASSQAQAWLLNVFFYYGVANRDWCYVKELLTGSNPYQDYSYWGKVEVVMPNSIGCEFFPLGVNLYTPYTMTNLVGSARLDQVKTAMTTELTRRDLNLVSGWPMPSRNINWALLDPTYWTSWERAEQYKVSLLAGIKPVYHTSGCDAVTIASMDSNLTLGLTNRSPSWTSWLVGEDNQKNVSDSVARLEASSAVTARAVAAAKPFGYLADCTEAVHAYRIVLPVFTDVRLIPVALSSGWDAIYPGWETHKMHHVPPYSEKGLDGLVDGCFFCLQLKTWEDPSFRQEGIDWLTEVDPKTGALVHECLDPQPGPGSIGGLPFAH
ncbi:MAG: pilus assembly protein TadG-related protein [Verrucomicrobiae bacterium]|nr:pilus assembly protein TadG-related protein [Verrucomicrobiae bacterium]